MKPFKAISAGLLLSALIAFAGCGKTGVDPLEDDNDHDAIYNIIQYDMPSVFDLNLVDFSVPDTSNLLSAPYQPLHFWRDIQRDSLFISILILWPMPGDSVGTVPQAIVGVNRYVNGTLEIIARDTSRENQTVRFSKSFFMHGYINSFFEKLGFDYNSRRGWVLRRVSDASFSNSNHQELPDIEIVGSLHPNQTYHMTLADRSLGLVPEFSPGESLTVYVHPADTAYYATVRFPLDSGSITRTIPGSNSGSFIGGFTLPDRQDFGHFTIDLIKKMSVEIDTAQYRPLAIGALYRVR